MQLAVDGHLLATDPEGYLLDLHQWNPAVAEAYAAQEGIVLDQRHWEVLHLLRDFYAEYGFAPATRPLVKAVGRALGAEKGSSLYLMQLFPGTPAKTASKLAGLPKPTNCL